MSKQLDNVPLKNKLLITVLACSVLLSGITVDMVTPVLGMIGSELGASESQISWVVTGVTIVLAIAIPFYGRLSDFIEARRLFTVGVLVLTVGSLLAAVAPSLFVLVIARMIQGAGMASISVVSIIVVSRVYPPGQRGVVLGIIAGSIGIGTAGGPIFGGLVGEWLGWQGLFWSTFVLGLLIVNGAQVSMPKIYPADRTEDTPFDVIGGIALGAAIGSLLLGITLVETHGWSSLITVAIFIISILSISTLVYRMVTVRYPFIPPYLLKNKKYVKAIAIIFLSMSAYFPILVFIPLMVVEINGLTPGNAGLLLLPGGGAVAILSPIVGRLSDRISPKYLLSVGLVFMVISTFILSLFAGQSPFILLFGIFGSGIAYAFINSPAHNFAVATLEKEEIGVGMGLFQGALFLGTGVGAAIIGALLSARTEAQAALNPFYSFDAFPYSDIFLVLSLVSLIALLVAIRLDGKRRSE